MTRDDIIKLARDAGFYFYDAGYAPILHTTKNEYSEKCFERFAAMVEAAEREACAKVCDEQATRSEASMEKSRTSKARDVYSAAGQTAHWMAAAIRARSQK